MNVLITGSTSCLGRLLVGRMASQYGDVVWTSSRSAGGGPFHCACDLRSRDEAERLIELTTPRVVFHLVGSYTGDYEQDLAVNAHSARHLLEAALRRNAGTRTVLVGSAAEYGLIEPGDNPVTECQPLRPVSVYGTTKAVQTLLAGLYAYQHGADVVVARLFNLMAPGLSERLFIGRIERLMDDVKQGRRTSIEVGSLDAERDYVDGATAVEQVLLIASRGVAGEVYNVGSGCPVSMRVLLTRLLADAGLDMKVVRERVATPRTGYDVPRIYADVGKTKALNERNCVIEEWLP
jgi:GDP-4-dehydro-6-deoxy-D-mannose reductase